MASAAPARSWVRLRRARRGRAARGLVRRPVLPRVSKQRRFQKSSLSLSLSLSLSFGRRRGSLRGGGPNSARLRVLVRTRCREEAPFFSHSFRGTARQQPLYRVRFEAAVEFRRRLLKPMYRMSGASSFPLARARARGYVAGARLARRARPRSARVASYSACFHRNLPRSSWGFRKEKKKTRPRPQRRAGWHFRRRSELGRRRSLRELALSGGRGRRF